MLQGTVRFAAMEILHIPALRNPVMLCAFTGWNDAAEAASRTLEHLLDALSEVSSDVVSTLIGEIDSDEYFDFQVNRPQVNIDELENRIITWPSTQVWCCSTWIRTRSSYRQRHRAIYALEVIC